METNERLRELLAKATPGPWKQCREGGGGCSCGKVYSETADAFVADFSLSADDETRSTRSDADTRKTNAALTAAMHRELPRLLADSDELAALRARIEAAPVVEIDAESADEVRLIAAGGPFEIALDSIRVLAMHGQRVALLPVEGR